MLEHIEAMHGRIPFAVVSGSRRASVVGSLTALHLLDKFDVLVCAEDYAHGKPAPDGFLLAASKLGVAPQHCLVFEDTELGIQAATAAGMQSVLVAATGTRELLEPEPGPERKLISGGERGRSKCVRRTE